MAAPKFAPVSPNEAVRTYGSPDHVPAHWVPGRPAEIEGRQPSGDRLGYQGPDQGYVLTLAERFRDKLRVSPIESVDDAIRGGINIALRRASLFGRAPVIHDLTIAFTIWGLLDRDAPADLIARRAQLFEGLANTNHHYTAGRVLTDLVPEATLRMTPQAALDAYNAGTWRELTGA
jgi:hypothetical protein